MPLVVAAVGAGERERDRDRLSFIFLAGDRELERERALFFSLVSMADAADVAAVASEALTQSRLPPILRLAVCGFPPISFSVLKGM